MCLMRSMHSIIDCHVPQIEVAEYQAELMVASQEDEGATIRIQDLERRGALMEHGARRIHQRGMEIQEEYRDEVHHLQGLLGNTEARLQQLHQTNVLTTDIATDCTMKVKKCRRIPELNYGIS